MSRSRVKIMQTAKGSNGKKIEKLTLVNLEDKVVYSPITYIIFITELDMRLHLQGSKG